MSQGPTTAARADSAGKLLAFVGPCIPLAGLGLPLTIHLPTFYARDLGLPLSAVGLAFLLVRLADIGLDPVLGALMDRTRTPLGRFRPWLIGAVPILMGASALLFMARPGVTALYLWAALVVGYAGFSAGSLSQQAWASALSRDYHGRSRVYGWWQAGNVLGMLLILLTPAVVQFGLHGSRVEGIRAMGWFLILTLPVTVALACWRVPDPNPPPGLQRPASVRHYLALLRNRSVAILMLADLLLGWAPGITGALFLFYFDQVKHVPDAQANLMLLAYFVAALAGAPLWSWLAVKIGKHRALACNSMFIVASLMLVWRLPLASPWLGFPIMALVGLPYSGASLLLRAMLADVGDELQLQTGADRTGLLYAVLTGTTKIGSALALVTFVILDAVGFDAQAAHNSDAAVAGLQALFVGAPALLSVVAAAVIMTYPLDARRHAEIRAALDARTPQAALAE